MEFLTRAIRPVDRRHIRAHIEERFFVIVQEAAQLDQRVLLDSNVLLTERRDGFSNFVAEALPNAIDQRVTGDVDRYSRTLPGRRSRLVTGCGSRFRGSRLLSAGSGRRWLRRFFSARRRRSRLRLAAFGAGGSLIFGCRDVRLTCVRLFCERVFVGALTGCVLSLVSHVLPNNVQTLCARSKCNRTAVTALKRSASGQKQKLLTTNAFSIAPKALSN